MKAGFCGKLNGALPIFARIREADSVEHEDYMRLALELAQQAAAVGEVPVGCVITDSDGNIVGRGRNRREETGRATAHAEVLAIESACEMAGDWRLTDCTMYVTLEPCPMCAGAIINSRIRRVFYGARDSVLGSCGSVINLFMENYGHSPQITGGILEDECAQVLKDFFRNLRRDAN